MSEVIEGSFVCDLSDSGTLRIVGQDAERFVQTMYSGNMAELEEVEGFSQGLLLTGQGEIIDLVNVMRTGYDEFLLMTSADNTDEAFEWLEAHAELEDDNGRVFADLAVENQSEKLAVLLMYGTTIEGNINALNEAASGQLPVIMHKFDQAAYGVPSTPAYLMFAPKNVASQIGEFLLQDLELNVEYPEELQERLVKVGKYCESIHEADYKKPADAGLESYLRESRDFVGALAL